MHTTLSKGLAAAALAVAATAAVAGTPVDHAFYLFPSYGPDLTQEFAFTDSFDKAGTSFVDTFLFNSPPATANVTFDALSAFDAFTGAQQVSFSSVVLVPYQPDDTVSAVPLALTLASFFASGQTLAALDSGIYALQISGTTLTDVASFSGAIEATVAVPEPETWALMLLGLGVVGTALRHRRS